MLAKYLGFASAIILFSGCPGPGDATQLRSCTRLHAQCQLKDGLLGVCNDAPCPEGQKGPCFKCVSQH